MPATDPAHATDWLLSASERANDNTDQDAWHPGEQAWSSGNHVRPLVHGSTYFAELFERIEATGPGDLIFFTDWRGDPDEQLLGTPGTSVAEVLGRADERGVDVRGLIWRSHWDKLAFSGAENRNLGKELQEAGAEVLLDMRVRTGGSHHQKFVVIRHRDDPRRDIAFVGGIDLCHSRRDDARHLGDPQPQSMSEVYGPTPPWHDVQAAISGPAVFDVESVFRERWNDPTPLSRNPLHRWQDRFVRGLDISPDPLPAQHPPPPPVPGGTHTVQLLRTYANLRRKRDYPFAVGGERSIARGYSKALERTQRLIYVEDQYLWSPDVANSFTQALQSQPDLHVIVVLPLVPDQDSALSKVPQLVGRAQAMEQMMDVAFDRVAFYGLENHAGTPVYVHAKVCVMDDWWASIGSDNFCRRSWTHDSELSAVVLDQSAGDDHSPYARRLRLTLAAEHLDCHLGDATFPGDISALERGREPSDLNDELLLDVMADCVDQHSMFEVFAATADRLDAWHASGRVGDRPPGRLRRLAAPRLNPVVRRLAAAPYYLIHDPDGRPRPLRRSGGY